MAARDNRFLNPSNPRGHNRQANGSRFQEHTRQPFPMRREQKHIEYFHDGRDIASPSGKMQSRM
jgi:hypothetical protein